MSLSKHHFFLNITNTPLIFSRIPINGTQKSNAPLLPETWLIVAFCLLPTAIAMLLLFAIQTVFSFIGSAIAAFLSTTNLSVVVTIAVSAAILFFSIALVQNGKRLFQSFWDSLGMD